ncbi:MAG: tetratricopeptide repeat protein [Betaproteobacteria bacterium]|nr:tetratricopeptide repeat protein [Betaproteobacteria bacterium]
MLARMLAGLLPLRGRSAAGCYRRATAARERGDWTRAIGWYRRALVAEPDHAEAHNDLGIALCAVKDYAGARAAFAQALALRGEFIPARVNLGQLLQSEFRDYRQAAAHYRAALAADPGQGQARNNLALTLYERGLVGEAIACLRETLQRAPDDALAHEFMLFMSNALPQRDPDEWYAEHRLWGQRHADGLPRYAHAPAGPARRLRIGYVSADLREHATAGFLRSILARHDPETFDIFCYSNSDEADALTQNLQRQAHCWRAIAGVDDARAAQLIHADAINILVDLSGHTRGNRLGVFARKPAPVQIGYLGYLNTSGMAAMDCRITDANADPPGVSDRLHSETLLRLPQTLWCYQPPEDAPSVTSLPAQRNGYITFGSFNHVAKLNERVLDLWAELLSRLPSSRLQVMALPDEETAARIRAALEKHGIDAARIRTLPRMARGQYWRGFSEVDIALDPFPYTGGATTCDSLWMGLPVVTLAGSFGFERSAATVLVNAGLAELVATDERQYLEIAVGLANAAPALAGLRGGMRERLGRSPLLDAPRFVEALERLYRGAWQRAVGAKEAWC